MNDTEQSQSKADPLKTVIEMLRTGAFRSDIEKFAAALKEIEPLLEANDELRSMFHADKVVQKTPYPGRRSGVDPIEFLMEQYGDEIRSGRLGSGKLWHLDTRLHDSAEDRLRSSGKAASVKEFFESQMVPEQAGLSLYQRRIRACACILGASEESAAAYFGTLRSGRVKERGALYRGKTEATGR